MKKKTKRDLILKTLGRKRRTANEIITEIFKDDLSHGARFIITERGWRFYVHLNKLFAPLERDGLIRQSGRRMGESGKFEKIWAKESLS